MTAIDAGLTDLSQQRNKRVSVHWSRLPRLSCIHMAEVRQLGSTLAVMLRRLQLRGRPAEQTSRRQQILGSISDYHSIGELQRTNFQALRRRCLALPMPPQSHDLIP